MLIAVLSALASLPPAASADENLLAHGRYLAAAAGCDQCHTDTKEGSRAYAGGRALDTPFGIIVTPNITSDRETGIGGWGLGDFARALRWGISPDDSHYLPIFPFFFYNRLSDNDLAALKFFLDGVPAVRQANRVGNLVFAASTRAAITTVGERLPGPWQGDPSKDAAWNRGAYLVATVGRCGDCHTRRNWLGTRDQAYALAGTPAGKGRKTVPNITPDRETGIGDWSEADIVTLLRDGHTPDFDFVGGAMAEIVRNTARLSDADRRAIAVYLRSLPAIHSEKHN